ncbi:hypothetical protein, partial [Corynebacterium flavescens]|uniref:hypothetical protein n=1 Tax=Corynebacterium flavescens TaxID=28028 RepID=UPI003FD0EA74
MSKSEVSQVLFRLSRWENLGHFKSILDSLTGAVANRVSLYLPIDSNHFNSCFTSASSPEFSSLQPYLQEHRQ